MNWLMRRLKEPSSWRGIVVLASIAGVSLSPEMQDKIIILGTTLIGLIEIIRKEKASAIPAAVVSGSGEAQTITSNGEALSGDAP